MVGDADLVRFQGGKMELAEPVVPNLYGRLAGLAEEVRVRPVAGDLLRQAHCDVVGLQPFLVRTNPLDKALREVLLLHSCFVSVITMFCAAGGSTTGLPFRRALRPCRLFGP